MALAIHKGLLHGFIQSMYNEGLVNDQFYQLQTMKETRSPDYVVRVVTTYCVAAQNLFSKMTVGINQPDVNFNQINAFGCELYARSTSVGAEHVKLACAEILRACEANNKEHCFRALYWTKNEFSQLRRKFETVVQMERKIIDLMSSGDKRIQTFH